VLNQITYQTALTTKPARRRLAAGGRAALVDFALRRTHGVKAGMSAARAAAITGFPGTSNVEAARRFGLPVVGTMANSNLQAFSTKVQAFAAVAADFPDRTTFVVDTYDTLAGVETAVEPFATLVSAVGWACDSTAVTCWSSPSRPAGSSMPPGTTA
jgi:nicotinate phosphoribosyltransferase